MGRGRSGTVVLGFAAAALLCACSSAAPDTAATSGSPAAGTELTVFAAASLKTTFTDLGRLFEQQHPGAGVRFSFAGSPDLVAQIQQGAGADVLATADTTTMSAEAKADVLAGSAKPFATNSMTIAVPPVNPAHVTGLADLAAPGIRVVVCAPAVPCGTAEQKVEQASGVAITPVSQETSVTDVMGKVTSGEADAGIVYVTDVRAAGDRVKGIAIPAEDNATNTYPIATVASAAQPELALQFEQLVLSHQGQRVLAAAGFGPAPGG